MENTDQIQMLLKEVELTEFTSVEALDQIIGSEFDGRNFPLANGRSSL